MSIMGNAKRFLSRYDDIILFVLMLVLTMLIGAVVASGQELRQQRPRAFSREDVADLEAIAGLSAMDAYSTHQALGRGNRELFLPDALARSNGGMWAFSAAKVAAQVIVTEELNRHGHHKLAVWTERVHVGVMGYYPIHNLALGASGAPAAGVRRIR